MNWLIILLAYVLFAVIAGIIGWVTKNPSFGISFFILAFGSFVLQGLRKIPAQPPHKAIRTIWGVRQDNEVVNEGWNFFPFYPWWHGFIPINVTKVNQDLKEQTVRTPDLAELTVPVSVTWTPAWRETVIENQEETYQDSPRFLIEFLNTGGENGVRTILEDIIRERLREWAISQEEGPKTWQEAMAAREAAAAILLKAVLGEELTEIPFPHGSGLHVPTNILMKYFRKKTPTESEAKEWGGEGNAEYPENWGKVQSKLGDLDLEDYAEVKKAVERRELEVRKARQGNGHFKNPNLGIILNRLNVGEIKPLGELAKAAELLVKEEREAKAEKFELDQIAQRIKELKVLGFSPEQALEVVQTERGKVTKTISEGKLSLSAETRAMIEKVGGSLLELLKPKLLD